MRKIDELVIHHGADARKFDLATMKRVYQDTHYNSLYKAYKQPRSSNADFPDIAYHVLIGTDGWEVCRPFEFYSYHASNLTVNKKSVAIVLTGNYDSDVLTPQMEGYFREAVTYIRKELPDIVKVSAHRDYATKSCPGKNIKDDFIKEVFERAGGVISPMGVDMFDEEEAKQYTTKDIMDEVVLRDDFIETTITVIKENIEVLRTRN